MSSRMHVMLDIETVGGPPDGAVVAIGAVKFNKKRIISEYEAYIPKGSALLYGKKDEGTELWWSKQDPEIRAKVFGGSEAPVGACNRFIEFCKGAELVWAKPITFDCVVTRHLFRQLGLEFPFHFRKERDASTLISLAKEHGLKFGDIVNASKHDPLSDARTQALQIMKILNAIRINGKPLKEESYWWWPFS